MTSFNRRVYELLGRVHVFATAHPHLFQKDSESGRLLEEAGSATKRITEHQLSQRFIDGHLPPDFNERLDAAVKALEDVRTHSVNVVNGRIRATDAVDQQARSAALAAITKLDGLVENQLQKDRPTLVEWRSARHVERYTSRPRRSDPVSATPKSAEKGAGTHGAADAA